MDLVTVLLLVAAVAVVYFVVKKANKDAAVSDMTEVKPNVTGGKPSDTSLSGSSAKSTKTKASKK